MLITVMLIIIAIISYGLGGFNGSIIVSRYVYKDDIRNYGSGNAGLTNFYRKYGPKFLASVVGIDLGKGIISALLGGVLLGLTAPEALVDYFYSCGRLFAAFCVIVGHSWPAMYRFKGGKGVLCGIGAALVIDWRAAAICLVLFLIIVFATRYVSLGSIIGALSFPIALFAVDYRGIALFLAFIPVAAILIRHSENIKRLINHKESKFTLQKDISHKLSEEDF
ncbi:MAG: glycerol-3-phosphate acyltransferase [Ruminococcaceae bacterium]|nr:glycerol-3-phosphate acyltransferase [Oscillospiraceae bacterium]